MAVINTLCVELTTRCPLRCLHCSADASPDRQEIFPPAILAKRLIELDDLQEIYLSGGEPFEYAALLDIIQVANHISRSTVIYSSGTIMNGCTIKPLPSQILSLTEMFKISRIDLSLYAAYEDLHDSITGIAGSFNATVESAQRINDQHIPLGIHYVPIGKAHNQIIDVARLAQDLNASRFHILGLTAQGRARKLKQTSYSVDFLQKINTLVGQCILPEVILSSTLRQALGDTTRTERDTWKAAFLDVQGFLYPGEGRRAATARSRSSVFSQRSFQEILDELRFDDDL
jgi:MoaA/NifB/PqqE/SkfB family radical SAM enzyme